MNRLNVHKYFIWLLLLATLRLFSQAAFTAIGTPYTQNFNTLPNTVDGSTSPWTNNTTLTGWYIDEGIGGTCGGTACDDQPTIEASYTTLNNGGNTYIYASGTDRSLGSRAAGSTGTNHIGIRLVNSTGVAITSVYVDYVGEQWSIAENGANLNTLVFSYQTGATVTSLTAGVWTNVTALDFNQIYTSAQSAGMGGSACAGSSAQCLALDGNVSANRRRIQGCINVAIPAGQEIMLRWSDLNDPANDHHMQLDDMLIYPFDVNCTTVLPVELLSFEAEASGAVSLLTWVTASETNCDYFAVERLNENNVWNEIGRVDGNGTTSQTSYYNYTDEMPYEGVNYYRLRQVDYDGSFWHSPIRIVIFGEKDKYDANITYSVSFLNYTLSGTIGQTQIDVFNSEGQLIHSETTSDSYGNFAAPDAAGIYLVRFTNKRGIITRKIAITPQW
jgi:hypothetical protein